MTRIFPIFAINWCSAEDLHGLCTDRMCMKRGISLILQALMLKKKNHDDYILY